MPLDPEASAFLAQMAALSGPQLHELPLPEARARMAMLAGLQGPGEDVERVADRAVPGPAGEIRTRTYRPAHAGRLPLIAFFHGGGWVLGGLETHDRMCRALANRTGAAVVSVDYRLAPEHPFPAAAEDAFAATTEMVARADDVGADPSRVAVAGDSAGANLAAVVALMARDRRGPALRHQLLVYPVIDGTREHPSYRENDERYLLTAESMRWFWDCYVPRPEDRRHPYASPICADDLAGLPPAFVLTAEYDPLRDEGEAYARRLADAGVPVRLRRQAGQIHGFFGMTGVFRAARRAFDEAAQAIRTALA